MIKKRFLSFSCCLILVFCFSLLLCSCGTDIPLDESVSSSNASMFVLVENGDCYKIVYHRDTKVMYAISDGHYNYGTFTVLLDSNGSPMLWSVS